MSILSIPLPGDKSDKATLIELLDEVEAFLCQLVVSGEDSLGTRLFGSNLYDSMMNAWRGDPAVPGSGIEQGFSSARSKIATINNAVLAAAGLSGVRLQVELVSLMQRAETYNEFGGRQYLGKLLRHMDRLLKSAGLGNVFGKLRDYLWASIVEDAQPTRKIYH